MAKKTRTPEALVLEYRSRGKSTKYIRTLATAIEDGQELLEYLRKQESGEIPSVVRCHGAGCRKLIPLGEEKCLHDKCYCSSCYKGVLHAEEVANEVPSSTVLADEGVLECGAVPEQLRALRKDAAEEGAPEVHASGSEEEPGRPLEEPEDGAGGEAPAGDAGDGCVTEASRRRMPW